MTPAAGGWRVLARRTAAAVRLAFSAAPGPTILLAALSVVEGLLPVLAAWSLKLLLDELTAGASPGRVALATAGIATAALLLGMRQSADAYVTGVLRRAVQLAVQDRLLRRVNGYVGLRRFEDPEFLDRLQLAEDAGERVPQELVTAALVIVRTTLTSAGLLVLLLTIWPPVALVLLAAAVPTVLGQLSLSRQRAAYTEGVTPLIRRRTFFNALLTDARAAKEVRLFGLGEWLHARVLGDLKAAHAAEAAVDRRTLRTEALLDLVGAAVTIAGAAAAAYQAVQGRLTIGDVSVFLTAISVVHVSVSGAATAAALAYQSLLLFAHYQDVVAGSGEPSGRVDGHATPLIREGRGIELCDVWFRYGNGGWALRGASLSIPAGATVALVGRNGAGKSTVVKLLCRMYEPDRGTIRWDGTDIRELDPAALRARIGAVFQDFMEYDLTAAENIGVGRLDAMGDLDAIRAAARAAGADTTLAALPAGYQTLLSRMFQPDDESAGSLLSGGQWQRVAIARAFLRHDADLMILDEPSAGLDAEAEHEVQRTLRALRAGRTSLLISHRLAALRYADLCYVLDEGQVVERGTHAELLAAGGTYARLFALQASGYRDDLDSLDV